MIYERLVDVLGGTDEPYAAARAALEALREPGPEILTVGISAEHWRPAVEAMLAGADAVDAAHAQDLIAKRKALWPAMRRELQAIGCQLWHPADDETLWRIEGPGVSLEVDLNTGEVEGLSAGPFDDPFGELVDLVRSDVTTARRHLADEARKEQLRQTHSWDKARRAWVPNNGNGPIIRGGGKAP